MESHKRKIQEIDLSSIKNAQKRTELYQKQKKLKKKLKKKERDRRQKEHEALGDEAPPKQIPRTIDNTREADETFVTPDDVEVLEDENLDEFSEYYTDKKTPKIIITTSPRAGEDTLLFASELLDVFPNSTYYKRQNYPVKDIITFSKNKEFTDLIVINDDVHKGPNGLLLIHLPNGPTANFRLSTVLPSHKIKGHGRASGVAPELILNNFNTRLGHSVGRMMAALFPQEPQFGAREVATFHNQRDFIFFRRHRYISSIEEMKRANKNKEEQEEITQYDKDNMRVRLQELGPRFTLKLKSVQQGTFDANGEYIWMHKPEMDTSRKRFFL